LERSTGEKKKLVKVSGFFSNKKESYQELVERLELLDPSSSEAVQIKQKINKMRNDAGLLTYAQIRELKDLELKPLKYPGDPDPAQNITKCPDCNGAISEKTGVPFCTNCDKIVDPVKGDPYQRAVPKENVRPKGFGPEHTYVTPGVPFNRAAQSKAKSKDHLKRNKENPDLAEHSDDTVKDLFEAKMDMCLRPPKRKNREYDDKLDVMRSCEDLAMDG